jgi:hypothetical protein
MKLNKVIQVQVNEKGSLKNEHTKCPCWHINNLGRQQVFTCWCLKLFMYQLYLVLITHVQVSA